MLDLPELPMRVLWKVILMMLPLSAKRLIIAEANKALKIKKNPIFTTLSFLFR
jgi:hypothetical protein